MLKELVARLMTLCFCCTATPNPALVSGAELDLAEFTEQDCEGQCRAYSGMQHSHISTGIQQFYNESSPKCNFQNVFTLIGKRNKVQYTEDDFGCI